MLQLMIIKMNDMNNAYGERERINLDLQHESEFINHLTHVDMQSSTTKNLLC